MTQWSHLRGPQDRPALWHSTRIFILLLLGFCLASPLGGAVFAAQETEAVHGAGASFPYPIYSKWGVRYNQISGLKLNYQSVGSGAGITQIKAKSVDFGASDEPLKSEELDKEGLVQFPMIMGGVVPVVNISGVYRGQLKLTPDILAEIFMGKITKWNDRKIVAVNQELRLPDREITVVHRADASGTTWIFTSYLAKASNEWKEKVGSGKTVPWPIGQEGKGNEGVSVAVKKSDGAIGYVEFAYALKERLKHVRLQNSGGKFVSPTIQTFQAAAANADWKNARGFYMNLVDQPGDKSWPITGASYILMHREQPDPSKAEALLKFFDWCFKKGSDLAVSLDYVPMPNEVITLVQNAWKNELSSNGKPLWK